MNLASTCNCAACFVKAVVQCLSITVQWKHMKFGVNIVPTSGFKNLDLGYIAAVVFSVANVLIVARATVLSRHPIYLYEKNSQCHFSIS